MRFFSSLAIISALGYGAYWVNTNKPELKYKALDIINKNSVCVIEPKYGGSQLISRENIPENQYAEPQLLLYPYLLLEVKYTEKNASTQEATILWDLSDGEMVLNTQNWAKSHGFGDCINAHADKHEYKLIKIIAKNKGSATRQVFLNSLNIEPKLLTSWLKRAEKKNLIIKNNNSFRIHIHKPMIDVKPYTRIHESMSITNQQRSGQVKRQFSSKQIINASESIFGGSFAIRSTKEVFLPVYWIKIQNPDGSFQTKYWNGLSGKSIHPPTLIE